MVTLITLHMLSSANYDQALGVLKKNTEIAKKAKGFVSRKVVIDIKDRLRGCSITAFNTAGDLEAFRKNPERPTLVTQGSQMFEKTISGNILVFTKVDVDVFKTDNEASNSRANPKSWKNRFTQISLHMFDEKNYEQGLNVLRVNTPIASKQKGFVSRQVYVGIEKPLKGYSVATWETTKDLEYYRTVPGRPEIVHSNDGMNYLKTSTGLLPVFPHVESGVFQVAHEA